MVESWISSLPYLLTFFSHLWNFLCGQILHFCVQEQKTEGTINRFQLTDVQCWFSAFFPVHDTMKTEKTIDLSLLRMYLYLDLDVVLTCTKLQTEARGRTKWLTSAQDIPHPSWLVGYVASTSHLWVPVIVFQTSCRHSVACTKCFLMKCFYSSSGGIHLFTLTCGFKCACPCLIEVPRTEMSMLVEQYTYMPTKAAWYTWKHKIIILQKDGIDSKAIGYGNHI